jgi:hypothetical protein
MTTETPQYRYVALQETSGEEFESWIYFIRLEGNEENLNHLKKQLDQVDWVIIDDLSTFDLDLEHTVSELTAKEMTKVELNVYFHRKFDGTLQKINFGFKNKDSNKRKIKRVFDKLGYGQIDEFIDKEDVDQEDLVEQDNEDDDKESGSDETSSSTSESSEDEKENTKPRGVPPALLNSSLPRFAKVHGVRRK